MEVALYSPVIYRYPPSFNLAHPFTEGSYYNNCQWHEPTQSGGVGQ